MTAASHRETPPFCVEDALVDQSLADFRDTLRALADMALLESAAKLLNEDETPVTPFIFALDERALKRIAALAADELRFRRIKARREQSVG